MLKLQYSGKRFRGIFLSYILIIIIPVSILSLGYLYKSFKKIEIDNQDNMLKSLRSAAKTVDNYLDGIEASSIRLSLDPNINSVIRNPYGTDKYTYTLVRNSMIGDVTYNALYYSMYIYIKISDQVLTSGEGIYSKNDFYDKVLIDDIVGNENNKKWYETREIQDNTANKVYDIITFSRKLPASSSLVAGNLVINIREDILFETLKQSILKNNISGTIVLDEKGKVIMQEKGKMEFDAQKGDTIPIQDLLEKEGSTHLITKDNKYFATYSKSDVTGWTYVSFIPQQNINKQIEKEIIIIVGILLLVLLLGMPISYYISAKVYAPFNNLLIKLGKELQEFAEVNVAVDEYSMVEDAIKTIIDKNKSIQTIAEENKPIIREKLISDLLLNNYNSLPYIIEKLEYAGVVFKYSEFIVLTVFMNTFKNYNNVTTEDIRFYVKNTIEGEFSTQDSSAWGILSDDDMLVFLINLKHEDVNSDIEKNLESLCYQLNSMIKRDTGVNLSFSFGNLCSDLSLISKSFMLSRKALINKAFVEMDRVYFCSEKQEELLYPVFLQKQISNGVKSLDQAMVVSAIDKLFDNYIFQSNYSKEELKSLVIMLILGALNEIDLDIGEFNQYIKADIFNKFFECNSPTHLKEMICSYFLEILKSKMSKNELLESSYYITKIIDYVVNNYSTNLSLSDVAAHVKLNPSYLSRLFKASTGKTVLEYITGVRIKKAKELLQDKKMTVQEISIAVGYNDAHGFIKAFKKLEHITPGEYRNNMLQS